MMTVHAAKTRRKCLAFLFLLAGGIFFSNACERNDSPVKGQSKIPEMAEKAKGEKESHTVVLSAAKQKTAGIEVRPLSREPLSAPLSATAVIELNADKVSRVSSRVPGKIIRLTATQGQRVGAGQSLAQLDTVELDQAWSEYSKARSRRELAARTLQREETLFARGVCPEKDVLKARLELSEVEADLALAREKFRLLGVDAARIESQKGNGRNGHPLISISSPLGGVIIEKSVTRGEIVGPDKVLFTVADLSDLWVVTHFYEKDLRFLRTGMGVRISVAAFPDREFTGLISHIGDVVEEKSRTVTARVTIHNAGGWLKPGMFATVLIDTRAAEQERILALPEEAVFIDGAARYVFLQFAPEKFKRTEIKTGRTLGKRVEVVEGLKEGDPVVIRGTFTLKSELKKETLEAD